MLYEVITLAGGAMGFCRGGLIARRGLDRGFQDRRTGGAGLVPGGLGGGTPEADEGDEGQRRGSFQ